MRIGIDARCLTQERTGIERYLQGMLDALARTGSDHEFFLYAHEPFELELPHARWHKRIRSGLGPTNAYPLWLQIHARQLAVSDRLDVFWGPNFLLPLCLPPRTAGLVTIHDLVPVLFPETMRWKSRAVLRLFLRPTLARATHVLADSRTTAEDLSARLDISPRKITVVTPGVAPGFGTRDPDEVRARLRTRFRLESPYILAVATCEPRKNLITLVRAFQALPDRRRRPLVIVGRPGWGGATVQEAARRGVEEGTIRFLGYVPDADLPWLYGGAELLAFPSLYEGFGIPVIEAMASGVPVLASDIPILREVALDAAEFLPATETAAWTRAIQQLLDQPEERARLRELGLVRAGRFTFADAAARFLEVVEMLRGWRAP